MFGRQKPEIEKPQMPPSEELTLPQEIEDIIDSTPFEEDDTEITSVGLSSVNSTPEIVTIVEKISGILSPYFIVLVGLFLYKNNVFLGTILIVVGILSLLKISWKDIGGLWEKIQKTLNSQETDFTP